MNGKQREEMSNQDLCVGAVILAALGGLIVVVLLVLDGFLKLDLLNLLFSLFLPIYQFPLISWFLKIGPIPSFSVIGFTVISITVVLMTPKKKPDSTPLRAVSQDEITYAWQYYEHADDLLHNRINLFLVAQSMLIISFATLIGYVKSYNQTCNQITYINIVLILIILIGAIYSLIWYYVCLKLERRLNFLNERILKEEDIYKKYLEWAGNRENVWCFPLDPLAQLIPMCTIGFWFILLVLTWYYQCDPNSVYYPILIIILLISLTCIPIRSKIPAKITEKNEKDP